jgi:hypothetical protein
MIANKIQHPTCFLASIYYLISFQYKVGFFFIGLFHKHPGKPSFPFSLQTKILVAVALAIIPVCFLQGFIDSHSFMDIDICSFNTGCNKIFKRQ